MKKEILLAGSVLLLCSVFLISAVSFDSEKKAVQEAILTGYVHGAFNELNPEAMKRTFHKDFAIFSTDGEKLNKYPIDAWVAGVEKRKASAEFDPEKNIWEPKFTSVDVTGRSAAVQLELHHNGKHVYTDYLSLLKFDDGWKIVAKVYHEYP